MTTPAPDVTTRETAIRLARKGMSMEGIAHRCGFSRKTLWEKRKAHPDFEAALMSAVAEYEESLLTTFEDATASGTENPALAAQAKGMLAQRFPQRHGVDPRLRLDARQAQEGYAEDLDDPSLNPSTQTPATVIASLVERMLNEDEGKTNADDR